MVAKQLTRGLPQSKHTRIVAKTLHRGLSQSNNPTDGREATTPRIAAKPLPHGWSQSNRDIFKRRPSSPRLGGGPEEYRPRPQGGTTRAISDEIARQLYFEFFFLYTAALDLCAGRWSSTNLVL